MKDEKMIGAEWSRIKNCVAAQYAEYPEYTIGVLPDYQNNRVGSALLSMIIEACRGKYPGLRLGVNEKAVRVMSFYTKFGFVEYNKYQ